MPRDVLIGIDLGTTVLKVCVFDARNGGLLGQASRRLKVHASPDGGREQKPVAVDRAFVSAVRELRDRLGPAWRGVQGIGLAAQGGSSIIADRSSGKAHTPMILWNDARTGRCLAEATAHLPTRYWRKHVLNDAPPAGLGRILWLKDRQPELFTDANIHIGAGEYLFFRLTGVWRQDAGNAIQAGSYNAAKKRLDRDPFRVTGLPLSFVAPLRQGHELASLSKRGARLLDLPQGLPVAGPYIDQEAAYMSTAGLSDRPLQCSLGTAWVGNFVLPDDTTGRSPRQLVIPSPVGEGRLVIMPLAAGNLTWEWALQTYLSPDPKKALKKAAAVFGKSLLPPEGLVAFPWFTLPNPYEPSAYGAGAFFGVNPQTRREDLVRAVVAGLTYELARIFDEVKRAGAIDSVVLGGGASNGPFFRTLIAGLFAPLPVLWQRDSDLAAARGALFPFSPRAARSTTRRVPQPAANVQRAIERGYSLYCTAVRQAYHQLPPGSQAFRFTN